ncbi:MAG TPA: tyrosine--tRNA ligase [Coxiellaceae bacterium]|nr:tyrosine--tRNA ligase [Coxiellaceae bacterium]
MMKASEAMKEIRRGAVEILVAQEFEERLASGRPLRVKLGLDPTAADIHLGHTVVLNKLRHFQEWGHEVLFLIGDFTAMIGDPTGRNVTRQPLSLDAIKANAETYQAQAFKILDPAKTTVMYNSQWMNKKTAADMIQLASLSTVARMLERDDFSTRYTQHQPIAIHEFLYPILQGYDSVEMRADVEIGGTDQTFNLLMGRELQKHFGQTPQCILTMPLLEGTDGVQKMSKSYGNYIGISEPPQEMFGKIMSISDELMWRYYELLSARSLAEIETLKEAAKAGANPRDNKISLAMEIIERYHSRATAEKAKTDFIERFQQGALPDDIEEKILIVKEGALPIGYLLKEVGLVDSTSDALRMIQQGAVKIDGARIDDSKLTLSVGETHVYQVGKRRFARVTIKAG